jgi:hypothetical protein
MTPAAAGPTDRTTAGTPIRAARQHWRCTAMPAGGLRRWPAVCFARVTETNRPPYEVWRGGSAKGAIRQCARAGADKGRSVTDSSLSGLSASACPLAGPFRRALRGQRRRDADRHADALVWEKKDDLGGIHDWDNTYSWTVTFDHLPSGSASKAVQLCPCFLVMRSNNPPIPAPPRSQAGSTQRRLTHTAQVGCTGEARP